MIFQSRYVAHLEKQIEELKAEKKELADLLRQALGGKLRTPQVTEAGIPLTPAVGRKLMRDAAKADEKRPTALNFIKSRDLLESESRMRPEGYIKEAEGDPIEEPRPRPKETVNGVQTGT